MSEAEDRRLAKFLVTVARDDAGQVEFWKHSNVYSDLSLCDRLLTAIAKTAKHPKVVLYQPDSARKMKKYVNQHRKDIRDRLNARALKSQQKLL